MQRKAMVIRLRPDKFEAYRALHGQPFPGVVAALKAAHIANYSIFHRDGLLFGYLEYHGSDWAADAAQIAADPETQRWWALTDPCQQPMPDAAPGEWWSDLESLFHLE